MPRTRPTNTIGVTIDVLGDTNPFSKTGRSSCYRVVVGGRSYLIDCGAPVFSLLSFGELAEIQGIFGTHSHDDHRRWLSDLALFRFYVFPQSGRLKLISTETILQEYRETSRYSLELSLNATSDRVVDVPYERFFDEIPGGHAARYRMRQTLPTAENPTGKWEVVDTTNGNMSVGPDVAKLVFNPVASRPRLLVKDQQEQVWVEPDIYYASGDRRFYLEDPRSFVDAETGARFDIVKDHSWHGLPTMGVKLTTANESVLFSSDTVYNPTLWQQLVDARPTPSRNGMSEAEFEAATVVNGDINDFIERVWSPERLAAALEAYRGAVVLQDTASLNSVVHTDYPQVRRMVQETGATQMILVHSPDRFVSLEWLSFMDRQMRVIGNTVYEEVGGQLYEQVGDVYLKEGGKFYVGFKRDAGATDARWEVIEKDNQLLDVIPITTAPGDRPAGTTLFHCALYEEIEGQLYPRLVDSGETYRLRADNLVELLRTTPTGSFGTLVSPLPRKAVTVGESGSDSSASKRTRRVSDKKDSDTGIRFKSGSRG